VVEGTKTGDKKKGVCLLQYAVYGIHFIGMQTLWIRLVYCH